jgi:hypothetical protein
LPIFQHCYFGGVSYVKNEKIDNAERAQIKQLNDKVYDALKSNNFDNLKSLMSPKLQEMIGQDFGQAIEKVSGALFNSKNYALLDEYRLSEAGTGNVPFTILSGSDHDTPYRLHFAVASDDSYVSLILLDTKPIPPLWLC